MKTASMASATPGKTVEAHVELAEKPALRELVQFDKKMIDKIATPNETLVLQRLGTTEKLILKRLATPEKLTLKRHETTEKPFVEITVTPEKPISQKATTPEKTILQAQPLPDNKTHLKRPAPNNDSPLEENAIPPKITVKEEWASPHPFPKIEGTGSPEQSQVERKVPPAPALENVPPNESSVAEGTGQPEKVASVGEGLLENPMHEGYIGCFCCFDVSPCRSFSFEKRKWKKEGVSQKLSMVVGQREGQLIQDMGSTNVMDLCHSCLRKLDNAYEFIIQCRKSLRKLETLRSNHCDKSSNVIQDRAKGRCGKKYFVIPFDEINMVAQDDDPDRPHPALQDHTYGAVLSDLVPVFRHNVSNL